MGWGHRTIRYHSPVFWDCASEIKTATAETRNMAEIGGELLL